ncbi:ferritin family protein [Ensifer sp. 2YAB10]|uniref:ferritin-like domain-containing protein n=1 Tax=unclassified Ensifer TaxID=2633371 RepID=UPI003F900CB3
MPKLTEEPPVVDTMEGLMQTAARMEREAIEGYEALRDRMSAEGRPELVAVFERLIAEEKSHLSQVADWSRATGLDAAGTVTGAPSVPDLFDAEGADLIPAEALSAYRAFSIAVRNEERAFEFWSYVAGRAPSPEIRRAAERMAGEELGHIATLRRERRSAFHHARKDAPSEAGVTLADLEQRLHARLSGMRDIADARELTRFADEAKERLAQCRDLRVGFKPNVDGFSQAAFERPAVLCGIVLDCYLDLMAREKDERGLVFAQEAASQLVQCLLFLRGLPQKT